jgi:microcystin-dependent protein
MLRKLFITSVALSASIIGTSVSVSPAQAQAEPFLAQLMLFGGNFCPRGWAPANGQLLSIAQNTAVFSLMGTQFGGNGQTTFALPDLRGRAPIHNGQGPGLQSYTIGQLGGTESFTLLTSQMPAHTHGVQATNVLADKGGPANRYLGAGAGDDDYYNDGPPNQVMAANMILPAGQGAPVSHRGPYLTMTWCVALEGIFPSRE